MPGNLNELKQHYKEDSSNSRVQTAYFGVMLLAGF